MKAKKSINYDFLPLIAVYSARSPIAIKKCSNQILHFLFCSGKHIYKARSRVSRVAEEAVTVAAVSQPARFGIPIIKFKGNGIQKQDLFRTDLRVKPIEVSRIVWTLPRG